MDEQVLVERVADAQYRLLRSPGLVLGIAAGDVIEVKEKNFRLVARGMNFCVQIFHEEGDGGRRLESIVTPRVVAIGGTLDGRTRKQLVYSLLSTSGIRPVTDLFDRIVKEFPNVEWYFGNVYDPADGVTPLNWWQGTSE